jgi:hypothetical protein
MGVMYEEEKGSLEVIEHRLDFGFGHNFRCEVYDENEAIR